MDQGKVGPNTFFTPSRVIFYVFSIIVFYFAVHYIGKLKDIEQLMMQMEPTWLFLAVFAQVSTYLVYALVLKLLVKDKPGSTDFFLLFKLSIVIMFVNEVLPTGGISGDGYIFNQLVKRNVSRYNAFTAMVWSRSAIAQPSLSYCSFFTPGISTKLRTITFCSLIR